MYSGLSLKQRGLGQLTYCSRRSVLPMYNRNAIPLCGWEENSGQIKNSHFFSFCLHTACGQTTVLVPEVLCRGSRSVVKGLMRRAHSCMYVVELRGRPARHFLSVTDTPKPMRVVHGSRVICVAAVDIQITGCSNQASSGITYLVLCV